MSISGIAADNLRLSKNSVQANSMRFTILSLACIGSLAVCLQAAAQAPCSDVRNHEALADCVDAIADFQCRNSGSLQAHEACFASSARRLLGNRIRELDRFEPSCFENVPNLVICTVYPERGGPGDWCIRIDANRIRNCAGNPPNHVCQQPTSCPLGACDQGCLVPK